MTYFSGGAPAEPVNLKYGLGSDSSRIYKGGYYAENDGQPAPPPVNNKISGVIPFPHQATNYELQNEYEYGKHFFVCDGDTNILKQLAFDATDNADITKDCAVKNMPVEVTDFWWGTVSNECGPVLVLETGITVNFVTSGKFNAGELLYIQDDKLKSDFCHGINFNNTKRILVLGTIEQANNANIRLRVSQQPIRHYLNMVSNSRVVTGDVGGSTVTVDVAYKQLRYKNDDSFEKIGWVEFEGRQNKQALENTFINYILRILMQHDLNRINLVNLHNMYKAQSSSIPLPVCVCLFKRLVTNHLELMFEYISHSSGTHEFKSIKGVFEPTDLVKYDSYTNLTKFFSEFKDNFKPDAAFEDTPYLLQEVCQKYCVATDRLCVSDVSGKATKLAKIYPQIEPEWKNEDDDQKYKEMRRRATAEYNVDNPTTAAVSS